MAEILIQIPPESLPWETTELDALWSRLEAWIDETLEENGLGRCVNVDFSSELSAWAQVADDERALAALTAALPRSGLPATTVLAERRADGYAIRWPPERASEHLDPF